MRPQQWRNGEGIELGGGGNRPIAPTGICPRTGRSRLSYERAEYLFKQHTRTLEPSGTGSTL
jgi:hypothetical protein